MDKIFGKKYLRTVGEIIDELKKHPLDALCYIDHYPAYGVLSKDLTVIVTREDGITEHRHIRTQNKSL
jgi:IS1 family transposase